MLENHLVKMIYSKIFDEQIDESFFICDLGSVLRQHSKFIRNLPRVKPFYAVKCNPDEQILKTIASMDGGFDCASMNEIKQILSLGISPERIIYANPCKPIPHIKYASSMGVHIMTFDNIDELKKIKEYHTNTPQMVLRILTDDSKSICPFGKKFGCPIDDSVSLLQEAKYLGIEVIGVSFHVGSGCTDPVAYEDAIHRSKIVFQYGKQIGYNLHLLDIGGGFPGNDKKNITINSNNNLDNSYITNNISFEEITLVINSSLEKYFPESEFPKLKVIAEPGRFYAESAFILISNITSRRVMNKNNKFMYYISDGIYGSFNCIFFDSYDCQPNVMTSDGKFLCIHKENELYESSVWGPTCDSIDCIIKKIYLPKLNIGDWLYFTCMGAYTKASSSSFNGFDPPKTFYI